MHALHARPTTAGDQLAATRDTGTGATWTVTRIGPTALSDPTVLILELPTATAVHSFASGWGLEQQPVDHDPAVATRVEVTSGRSSQGAVPWLGVETADTAYAITLHWSGNWRIDHQPQSAGSTVTVALHPAGQQVSLGEGESLTLPAVSVGSGSDLAEASASLVRHLAAQVPTGPPLLTEWNHWWPYEDAEIDEHTFLTNAAVAADLGLEVAVLDAGWFGGADATTFWYEQRGDWDRVNTVRFPHGLAWLAEQTRALGIDFGIWIEGEAVGSRAEIAQTRPELLAVGVDGDPLGYLCLGSPAARTHLLGAVSEVVRTTGARWLKWDFNLDPGAGCTRTDHGHLDDDGLRQHYLGLYALLAQLRTDFPDTVLEACSSGGLRIDAGLAAHVDGFFLSDPDWTEHHLTCLWGAARMLPPRQLLHWPQSEWRGEHRFQHVDYSGSLITVDQFDTKIRSALLHRFGISVRLTEMRPDLLDRLRAHVRGYQTVIRPLLEHGELITLTAQPLREEQGCRQPAFQLEAGRSTAQPALLVAGFRLPPTGGWDPVHPRGVDPRSTWTVQVLDGADLGPATTVDGESLATVGLTAPDATSTSVLWLLRRC